MPFQTAIYDGLRINMQKLIIGLGNPGEKYKNNRHNVGYMVIDELISKIRNPKSEIRDKSQTLIFKSKNFMNDSGSFVLSLYTKYRIQNTDMYIVHDDLDIPLGSYKIQFGKGPKEHNGLVSVDEALGTSDYWRVRVGIENRAQRLEVSGERYVLQDFTFEERKTLDKVIEEIARDLIHRIKPDRSDG